MNTEHSINLEIKQLENSNNYKSVIAIKNNLLTKYDIDIDSSTILEKLINNLLLFQIKENLFVSRSKFEKLIKDSKDREDLKNNLFDLYFLEFSLEEVNVFINNNEIIEKYPTLEVKKLDKFEILSIYIAMRSHKYFILKYTNYFDEKYSNFLSANQLYSENKVTELGKEKSKVLEHILVPEYFKHIEFVKLVTNKELSFDDLAKILKEKLSLEELKTILSNLNSSLIKDTSEIKTIERVDATKLSHSEKKLKLTDNNFHKKDNDMQILSEKIINLNYLYEQLNSNYSVSNDISIKKVMEQILSTQPLKIEEIKFNLNILFNLDISLTRIKELLLDFTLFKRISAFEYSLFNSKYTRFSGDFKDDLDCILQNFKENEKKVFQDRIIENLTLKEVGDKINLTRERVRQMEKKIGIKLQTLKISNILNSYFFVIDNLFKEESIWHKKSLKIEIKKYFKVEEADFERLLNLYMFFKGIKFVEYYNDFIGVVKKNDIDLLFKYTIGTPIEYKEFIFQLKKINIKNLEFIKKFIEIEIYIVRSDNFILIKDGKTNIGDKIRLLFFISQSELRFNDIQKLFLKHYNENIPIRNISTKLEFYKDIFVRTYIGTYSLCEWGSEKHVSSRELIKNYFEVLEKPAKIEDIVDSIIKKCRVGEGTVKIFVGEDKDIFAYSHGEWALKKWKDDPEKSKKYKISSHRIEASLNNLVHTNHKGFFRRENQLVSLHHAGETYFKDSGHINIGKKIEEAITSKSLILEYKQKKYSLFLSDFKLYGTRRVLKEIGISIGDYFYLVYLKSNKIQLFKWNEFENINDKLFIENLSKIETVSINKEKSDKVEKSEETVQESSNVIMKDIPFTFQNVLDKGLKDGRVSYSDIEKINYDLEDEIFNMYEAIEELENSGIMIS